MMQCGTCNHWVHAKCEDLTGDFFFFFLNLNLSEDCFEHFYYCKSNIFSYKLKKVISKELQVKKKTHIHVPLKTFADMFSCF